MTPWANLPTALPSCWVSQAEPCPKQPFSLALCFVRIESRPRRGGPLGLRTTIQNSRSRGWWEGRGRKDGRITLTSQGKGGKGAYDFPVAFSGCVCGENVHTQHILVHTWFLESRLRTAALCVTTGVPASLQLCPSSEGGYTLTKVS